MVEIRQTEVYSQWFNNLRDRQARARIDVRIRRLSLGNPGDVKPVGEGVSELRIDYGPGYRVYFVHGRALVISSPGRSNTHKDRTLRQRRIGSWLWELIWQRLKLAMGRSGTS
jgi:putative addiction module killer protein